MKYDHDEYPFDTDNRAWRRHDDLLGEHFNVVSCSRDDGRPILVSVIDLDSGDTFTIAVLDSFEIREPHALLVFSTSGEVSAHGPFAGGPAAQAFAPHLALADPNVAATRPLPLHHHGQPDLPDDRWVPIPPHLARLARPALVQSRTSALILMNRTGGLIAAVGPFANQRKATGWPSAPHGADVDRLLVPLHPVPEPALEA